VQLEHAALGAPSSASRTRAGSAPALVARTSASPIASIVMATTIWLQALATCPAPESPTWTIVVPRACSTGSARSNGFRPAADHEREAGLARADFAARDGRIQQRRAPTLSLLGQLARGHRPPHNTQANEADGGLACHDPSFCWSRAAAEGGAAAMILLRTEKVADEL
jgi:hypothetical protein